MVRKLFISKFPPVFFPQTMRSQFAFKNIMFFGAKKMNRIDS